MLRCMLQELKWHRQWWRPYGTSSLFTMFFPKRFWQIKDATLRVSWWLTSMSWWECRRYRPVRIIHRPMVNVKHSTPLWLICLEPCPRKRSQSGRITLEHWSMPMIALKIWPQGSAPTISCLVDNLTFWLMWHLVWLHTPSWSQTQPNLSKSWENGPSRLTKKWKPFRQKRLKGISAIMTKKAELQPWRLGTQS